MIEDLSLRHQLVGDLFELPKTPADWQKHCLPQSQVNFYRQNGYLPGVRLLSDEQVEAMCEELATLVEPSHPGHQLFYEYHSNEAADKTTVLFHALGTWRITPAMHDVLWNPDFTVAASQLLDGAVRFWHDQLFCKPAAARRRRGLAPGLLVLDPDEAHRAFDLLDRPGRFLPRKRLPALHPRQPSLAAAADYGPGGRHERHPDRLLNEESVCRSARGRLNCGCLHARSVPPTRTTKSSTSRMKAVTGISACSMPCSKSVLA